MRAEIELNKSRKRVGIQDNDDEVIHYPSQVRKENQLIFFYLFLVYA